jgi:protein-tyrosine phosphatase
MIDIHTHILPSVDDGSTSLANSLEMLREEVNQGVSRVVLTPHYRASFNKTPEELKDAFYKFKEEVEKANIGVDLYLGQEIHYNSDTKRLHKEKSLLTIGSTAFALVEFDFVHRCEIAEAVHELKCEGLRPIVAHPERYDYLTLDDVYEIKTVGGFMQINADSIVGPNKKHYKKIIKNMYKEGFVDFVASDIHFGRLNCMREAYKYVHRHFGVDAAEVTFNLNAEHLLKG